MKRPQGFTLIEMLVSLTLFTALVSVLMFGFSQGLRLWDRVRSDGSLWQALELRQGLLNDVFAQAQVEDYYRVDSQYIPYLEGSEDSIRLLTRGPMLDLRGRIRPVSLRWVAEDDRYTLVYFEGQRHQDPARGIDWNAGEQVVLLEGASSPGFRFEAPVNPLPEALQVARLTERERARYRDTPTWRDDYSTRDLWLMPNRVRVSFVDANGEPHRWTFALPQMSDAWSLEGFVNEGRVNNAGP